MSARLLDGRRLQVGTAMAVIALFGVLDAAWAQSPAPGQPGAPPPTEGPSAASGPEDPDAPAPAPAEDEAAAAEDDIAVVDEVVVTGTSIRGIAAVGSQALQVTREDLVTSGHSSPVDVLRQIPQIHNLGFDEAPHVGQNAAGNIQRGSSVNLRGLGSNATLLLIDGHRIAPSGNVFSFTEANQLPVSAIERVEVIADGASAIYGSDAVAGVVNYITRKNFRGVEVGGRYTTSEHWDQWGASILLGTDWDIGMDRQGHIVVAYDHDERSNMRRGSSRFLREDLRPFGGPDTRIRGNNATASAPGNIVAPRPTPNPDLPSAGNFNYFGVRPGSSGVGLTTADLLLNQPNLADVSDFADWLPETKRDQLSIYMDQNLTDNVRVWYQGFVNRRESVLRVYPQSGVRTLPATSPFYVRGVPGIAPNAPQTVIFSLFKDVGVGEQEIRDTETSHTLGVKAELANDWAGEFSFTNSINRNCANCIAPLQHNISAVQLQAALNNGTYNPFSSTPADAAVLARILPGGYDKSHAVLNDWILRFDGPLFSLPGGEVRAAVGAEYMYIDQARTSIGIQATSDTVGAFSERKVHAGYAELFIPIIGSGNAMPFAQRLLVDIAVRSENYSDFGTTTNPKIGVTWDVTDDFTLRGAWGTSFRAPNLIENNPQFFSRVQVQTVTNAAGDPAIPVQNTGAGTTNIVSVAGSNADLTPEEATNWSVGADWRPAFVEGAHLSLTYYNIEYSNQIIGLQGVGATFLASPQNRALYDAFIIPAPQPTTCVNGNPATYNPLYLDPLGRPSLTPIDQSNFCSSAAILLFQNANAATTKQDGIDLLAGYEFDTAYGEFAFEIAGTKVLNNDFATVEGSPPIEGLDIINFPVSLRGRGNLRWSRGPWTANLWANYIGEFTNNLPITVNGVRQPVADIPSWTTWDAGLVYRFEDGARFTDGVRLTLTARNLFDEEPPVVLSANGNAMDVQNHNPYGRVISVQATKSF